MELAPSPLYRVLVDYERHFRAHCAEAESFQRAAAERHAIAQARIAEQVRRIWFIRCYPAHSYTQRTQQAAVDAAVSNVERHFRFIRDVYTEFASAHAQQAAQHDAALASFDAELQSLANAPIIPAAATPEHATLLDLLPEAKLRAWADYCRRSHVQFNDKVAELDRAYSVLRQDVDALLMQGPRRSLEELAAQERLVAERLEEQSAIVNTLASDFKSVQAKVEDWARIIALSGGGQGGVDMEELRGMEEINCVHLNSLLPRVREVAEQAEGLAQAAVRGKVRVGVGIC